MAFPALRHALAVALLRRVADLEVLRVGLSKGG